MTRIYGGFAVVMLGLCFGFPTLLSVCLIITCIGLAFVDMAIRYRTMLYCFTTVYAVIKQESLQEQGFQTKSSMYF